MRYQYNYNDVERPAGTPYSKPAVRVRPEDQIRVMVFNPDGRMDYTYTATGLSSVTEAIDRAFEVSGLGGDIRSYTFRVTNDVDGASELYRMNAHDNVHLIV